MAEREGFEPSERLRAQQFSRLPRSTTPAPLRIALSARWRGEPRPGRWEAARLAQAFGRGKPKYAARVRKTGDGCHGLLVTAVRHPIFRVLMDRALFFSPQAGRTIDAPELARTRFAIGDVVRHRMFDFRGVIFDIDPVFANSDEWYDSIPEGIRPDRNQPFYHLFAETDDSSYTAYVSQQNLVSDSLAGPVEHPEVDQMFEQFENGRYRVRRSLTH